MILRRESATPSLQSFSDMMGELGGGAGATGSLNDLSRKEASSLTDMSMSAISPAATVRSKRESWSGRYEYLALRTSMEP